MAKKALLLGAGFSYDLGMPLVKGLTQDFFHFLNPARMKNYIDIWKMADPYGSDRPIDPEAMEEVFDIYMKYYDNSGSNYEEFLKNIQKRHNELGVKQACRDSFHYAFGKYFDIIVQMFWMYHVNNLGIYMENKKFYEAFSNFLSNEKLWVLSLNHDLFIEFMCFENDIPLSYGASENITFPESNYNLNNSISFGKIPRCDMELDKMGFIRGKRGVNLLKLHGAINEFFYDNDKNILYIEPMKNESPVSYLSKVNKVLHEMNYFINGTPAKIIGDIAISDFNGKMQFLRKSILTGGYKYSETFDPKPGEEKIKLMEEILSKIDELIIIGYGFGDKHINLRLYNAMLLNKELSITIIDPNRIQVPDILRPFDYKSRIRRGQCGVAEWMTYLEKGQWDIEQSEKLENARRNRLILDREYRKKFL